MGSGERCKWLTVKSSLLERYANHRLVRRSISRRQPRRRPVLARHAGHGPTHIQPFVTVVSSNTRRQPGTFVQTLSRHERVLACFLIRPPPRCPELQGAEARRAGLRVLRPEANRARHPIGRGNLSFFCHAFGASTEMRPPSPKLSNSKLRGNLNCERLVRLTVPEFRLHSSHYVFGCNAEAVVDEWNQAAGDPAE